jgi:hypothetical protein
METTRSRAPNRRQNLKGATFYQLFIKIANRIPAVRLVDMAITRSTTQC